MASPLFHDLSLLSSSAAGHGNSSSRLLLSARALELGYAAIALDHPHRGLLADSSRCYTQPFAPLSSLPLPTSAALHRRLLASPTTEPFRQYTRITLCLDSPAAAASALTPSAARLLRTYDIVAARPLTQAAFDHLCQVPYSQQVDLISIDFSHKLPFRLKLPMLKLAMQRGLYFEITYSDFTVSDGDKYTFADVKLLVDWIKGKNLIISSAAHTATQLRGPYDIINLCSYLLDLPMNRAKAAISTNPRSLILKALRKKHFYKETIRINRLLPHEQLDLTKVMLSDLIGWDSESCRGDLPSSETNQLESSSTKDQRPNSPVYGVIQVSHDSHHNPNVSNIAKPSMQPTSDNEIPSLTQDGIIQADVLMDCGLSILPTSLDSQDAGPCRKSGNNESVLEHFMQVTSDHYVELKNVNRYVDDQDAMEVDATESSRRKLIVGNDVPSTSGIKLAYYAQHHVNCVSDEREKTPLAHKIFSGSDVCFENRDVDQCTDIPLDTEACSGTLKLVECPLGEKDDKGLLDLSINKDIEQIAAGAVESTDLKTRKDISVETSVQGQEISSIGYTYHKRLVDTHCASDELKEQRSVETISSLQNNIAETHEQPLNYPFPVSKVEIPTVKPEKWRRKLRSHCSAYLPFLGFLKSAHFKRKVCRMRPG